MSRPIKSREDFNREIETLSRLRTAIVLDRTIVAENSETILQSIDTLIKVLMTVKRTPIQDA